jgi:hypothetical protein
MYLYVILVVVAYFIYKSTRGPDIKSMVQKCAKWATTAQQDASLLTGMTHANYAMGYLLSIKEMSTPNDVHRQTGINFKKFEEHITNVQEMMNQRALKKYPDISEHTDLYLSSIAETGSF